MDENVSAEIFANNISVGVVSLLNRRVAKKINLKKSSVIAEIRIKDLLQVYLQLKKVYQAFDKYPALIRDLAFVVDEKISYEDIKNTILNFNEYIQEVKLFDVYRGEKLGKAKKSLAFTVKYHANKTLRAEEVDAIQSELLQEMENKFEAKIRDF